MKPSYKPYLLEACTDSFESARAAAEGGANRLELCSGLVIGGLTPSPALFSEIRKHLDIPIHVLLRPRFGDFCYTQHECQILLEEVRQFKALGAQGVVIGVLTPEGSLNLPWMERMMEAAEGMSVTLHRAFDVCRDPFEALDEAIRLGVDTILTSGQKDHCLAGKALLADLNREARGRLTIMAGAGVGAHVMEELHRDAGIHTFHMSGKKTLDSAMVYRKEGVNMGLPSLSEYEIWQTDASQIKKARQVLDGLAKS